MARIMSGRIQEGRRGAAPGWRRHRHGAAASVTAVSVTASPLRLDLARPAGLLLGLAADAVVGDPRRGHPVAGFGRYAAWVEGRSYRDDRTAGALHLTVCLLPVLALGVAVDRAAAQRPWARTASTGLATWAVLGARSLAAEGRAMAAALEAADPETAASGDPAVGLATARARLPNLCGRDPAALDASELARATVESLAENASDAVVCPLLWGAAFGLPGLLGHRAVNTLDAMVGHRSPRYARFGTASARADDAMGWVPARLTGVMACATAPTVGGSSRRAWRVMRRDHAAHPSPNGGWPESAWAGALGVRLGGRNVYAGRVEERPFLGDGGAPTAAHVRRAARLVTVVSWASAIAAVGVSAIGGTAARVAVVKLRGGRG